MRSILIEEYNAIARDIENGLFINKHKLLFLLASGKENGFCDEYGKDVVLETERDFIKCVIDPTTDNYTAWVEIDDWVYIDIHPPHREPMAVKVNIRNIKSLGPADPVEYKFLICKYEWI